MRTKIIVTSGVSAILLISLCLIIVKFACAPIQTNVFLPAPDSAICGAPYKDEHILSNNETRDIFESFMMLMQNIEDCDAYLTDITQRRVSKYKRDYSWLMLEYNKRRQYVGTLETQTPLAQTPFTFDSVLLILQEEHIVVILKKGTRYCGIDKVPKTLHFSSGYADFRAEVLALVA